MARHSLILRGRCRLALAVAALLLAPSYALAGQITLAWDAPSTGANGYVLRWGTSPGVYTNSINVGNVTTYTVRSLGSGTYYFVVEAYIGSNFGPASNQTNGVPTNQAPVLTNPGAKNVRSGAFSLTLSASDADQDVLTYSAQGGFPAGVIVNATTGVMSGNIAPGNYNVTVRASDGVVPDDETFTLTVTANNTPTLAPVSTQSHTTNDTVSLQMSASDADGDPLTFAASSLPAGVTINTSTGLISGKPAGGSGGTRNVNVTVSDGSAQAIQTFSWSITDLVPPALVGHWRFDETSGTSALDSAGGKNGTVSGSAAWAAGQIGNGLNLNGSTFVSLPAFDVAGNGLTVTAWVKTSSFPEGNDQRIVVKADGTAEQAHYWMLSLCMNQCGNSPASARLRFRLKTTDANTTTLIASSGTIPLNTWYHAAASYDGTTMRLYLNGTLVGSTTKNGAVSENIVIPVNLGRSPEGSNFLNGALDDVRIYSKGLSAVEIEAVMNSVPETFTDETLTSGSTVMKGIHVTELRTRINALRATRGLAAFAWTDATLTAGSTMIKAVHVNELRTALNAVFSSLGLTLPTYTDSPTVAATTTIKAVHITELRARVTQLE